MSLQTSCRTNQPNYKNSSQKLPDDLHHRCRLTTKHKNHKRYKLYRADHAKTNNLWRTVENITRHQFDLGLVNTLLSNNAFTNLNI